MKLLDANIVMYAVGKPHVYKAPCQAILQKALNNTEVFNIDAELCQELLYVYGRRGDIVNHLESKGIQTRMLFAGNLIKHPCFDEMRRSGQGYRTVETLENTDRIMRDTFWIGVYPGMAEEIIEYMIGQIKKFSENTNL